MCILNDSLTICVVCKYMPKSVNSIECGITHHFYHLSRSNEFPSYEHWTFFFWLSVIVRQQIWIIMMTRFAWLRFCFFECKINLSVALTTLTIWIWDICLYSVCRAFWMVQPNSMERAMEIVRNKIEPIANVSRHRWVYLEVHTTNK